MRRQLLALAVLMAPLCAAQDLTLPNKKDSFHFGVIGDTGTGGKAQYQTAEQFIRYRSVFPFTDVIMLGDNVYGGEKPKDFAEKFERPYEPMLQDGVKFYAALGNHDDPNQRFYKHFNMGGKRFYSFKPRDGIRFFALDSNYMDKEQIDWLEKELSDSASDWKIAFFHHPLYSSGEAHGPDEDLRKVIEPLLVKYGVSVVFAGHEHFYERLKPQKGIHHFIQGGSAKLRKGNIRRSDQTAVGFDTDNTFTLCEIDGDRLFFQTITRTGKTIDKGVIDRVAQSVRSAADKPSK
jgi:3',5'-cyclic AMP phosphodiesterase CpdA